MIQKSETFIFILWHDMKHDIMIQFFSSTCMEKK